MTKKLFGIIDGAFGESRAAKGSEPCQKAQQVLPEHVYREKVEADKKMREIFSRLYQRFIIEILLEAEGNPNPVDFENTINYYPITVQVNSQGEHYREVTRDVDIYGLYDSELKVKGTLESLLEGKYQKDGLMERDMVTGMGLDVDVAMLRAKLYLHRRIYKMQSKFDLENKLAGEKVISDDERFELYKYTHHGRDWQNTFQDGVDSIKKSFDLLSGSGTYGRESVFDYYEDLTRTRILSVLAAVAPIGEIVPRGGRGYFFVEPFDRNKLPELTMSEAVKNYMMEKKEWVLKNVISDGHYLGQGHMTGLGCPMRNTGQIEQMARSMLSLARKFHAAGRMENVRDKRR